MMLITEPKDKDGNPIPFAVYATDTEPVFQTVEQMRERIAELEDKVKKLSLSYYTLMDNEELLEAAKDLPFGSLGRVLADRLEDEMGLGEPDA